MVYKFISLSTKSNTQILNFYVSCCNNLSWYLNKHFRNLESAELPVYSVKAHKEIINCLDGVGGAGIGEGAPEIVTGSRDGTLTIQVL